MVNYVLKHFADLNIDAQTKVCVVVCVCVCVWPPAIICICCVCTRYCAFCRLLILMHVLCCHVRYGTVRGF